LKIKKRNKLILSKLQMLDFEYLSVAEKVSMADDWFEVTNENHFWMKWRFESMLKHKKYLPSLGSKVLEIGCGSCVFSSQLESISYISDACDLNVVALNKSVELKGKKFIYNIYDKNEKLINSYPAIFLMDVIEHIDEHVQFLKTASEHAKKGGIVVINVPAKKWLFSEYDVAQGHKRRYTIEELKQTVNDAGLEWVDGNYWGFSLIPVLLLRKLVLSFKKDKVVEIGFEPPNKFIHWAFQQLRKIELSIPIKMPSGTSVMAICRVK